MDADGAKKLRTIALSNFTKSANTLEKFIKAKVANVVVEPQYKKVVECFNKLEDAHNTFLQVTNIDIDAHAEGIKYMDIPGERYGDITVDYSNYLSGEEEKDRAVEERKCEAQERLEAERKKREAREAREAEEIQRKEEASRRFKSLTAELESAVESFQRMSISLKDTLENASGPDIRREWSNAESEFKALKDKLVEISGLSATDEEEAQSADLKKMFEDDGEKAFLDSQKWVLQKLKECDGEVSSGGNHSSSSGGAESTGSTKKEYAELPSFAGDEKKSPYLQFPVWKKNWDELIIEHNPKWRRNFLFKHLDEAAKEQLVGCEDNYAECMERLEKIYGNPTKVIKCVLAEIKSPKAIAEADYNGLVNYSNILERNFNRLKSAKREQEMSNSTVLATVLRKFPRQIMEKWNEFLAQQSDADQLNSFPVLIKWVNGQRSIWEQMAITTGADGG